MWKLLNHTPYAADRGFIRDQHGAEIYVVVIQACFDIGEDGTTVLAKHQNQPLFSPEYFGETGFTSLKGDSAFVPEKTNTDLLLHGYAYTAPGSLSCRVGFRVGKKNCMRTIRRFGRTVEMDPQRFLEKIPLAIDDRDALRQKQRKYRPSLLGPIPVFDPRRRRLAGRFDADWEKNRAPLLPQDFNPAFYQSAPPSQQAKGFLRGGEPAELFNLTSTRYLAFRLPRVHLALRTNIRGRWVSHRPQLHTVLLEPEGPRVTLAYHSALDCRNREQFIDRTIVREKKSVTLGQEGA